MRLTGKVVVVTGGSMGIGEAIGRVFAGEGASVVLLSREASRAEAARQRIGFTDRTLALACDVRHREEIDRAVKLTLERFKRIDIWVNNAGYGVKDYFADMDVDACRELFATNFFGALDGMKAVIPVMKQQNSGAIINISSVAGHFAFPGGSAYCATKFALNAASRAARLELRKSNINVLTVCPGYVSTNFSANVVAGERFKNAKSKAFNSISPERVARAALSGYLRKKREIIVPWTMIPIVKLYQLFPRFAEWGMQRTGAAD